MMMMIIFISETGFGEINFFVRIRDFMVDTNGIYFLETGWVEKMGIFLMGKSIIKLGKWKSRNWWGTAVKNIVIFFSIIICIFHPR